MSFSLKKLLALSLLTASLQASAQQIQLGYPTTGGTGCPAGSAQANLTPDGSSLSIIFDQFVTEAGPASGRTLDRKNCQIAIPVVVPGGYSVSLFAADYRGFVSLPQGATARMTVDYFFANAPGARFARDFRGRQDSDYLINHNLEAEALVWSPCGAQTQLRVNASMMVRNTSYQDAMATVDSADINAGIVYHVRLRRCR